MKRFENTTPPIKRALRNSAIMAIVVGIVVNFQGETAFASITTMLFTFAVIFPALWLSYRFTEKLMKNIQAKQLAETAQDMPSNEIQVGQTAPDFAQFNQHHQTKSLQDYAGKNLVLYFYPKDDTPGCTIEANEFTQFIEAFKAENTAVVGVSKDNCESHQAFIEKFDLKMDLLADTEGTMCEAYDVWREKERDGVKKMGIVRSTFIIDPEGEVVYAKYGVTPEAHAEFILDFIKEL